MISCVDLSAGESTVMYRGPKIVSELKKQSRITKTDTTSSSSSYGSSAISPIEGPGHRQRSTSAASSGSGGYERERVPEENGRYTKLDSKRKLDSMTEAATQASSIRGRASTFQSTTASSSSSATSHSAGSSNTSGALDADSVSRDVNFIFLVNRSSVLGILF